MGTATVTVTGKGSYTGTKKVTFKIVRANVSKATVASISNRSYTGSAIKPTPTVRLGGTTLKRGTDYTLSYANNTKVGTATVTVTGKGSYTGTKKVTFKIVRAGLSKATVASIADRTYTGSAIKPTPTVRLGSRTLKKGTDYTIAYKNNVRAGTGTLTFTGKGSYTGTKTATFKINAKHVANLTVATMVPRTFTGTAITPTPTIRFNDKVLKKGTDYDLSYEDNVNVGTGTVVVTGKGNFRGTKRATFAINAADVAGATIAAIPDQEYAGTEFAPEPEVSRKGIALVRGTDYDLSYADNVNVGTATVTVTGKGNFKGTKSVTFAIAPKDLSELVSIAAVGPQAHTGEAVEPKPAVTLGDATLTENVDYTLSYADNVELGTAKLIVTGIGNYTGSKELEFEITDAPDNDKPADNGETTDPGIEGEREAEDPITDAQAEVDPSDPISEDGPEEAIEV